MRKEAASGTRCTSHAEIQARDESIAVVEGEHNDLMHQRGMESPNQYLIPQS